MASDEQMPPDWAIERANRLLGAPYNDAVDCRFYAESTASVAQGIITFARYIAEHEEEPVDPLLIEARRFASENFRVGTESRGSILEGGEDNSALVKSCLAAIKRGIEIGGSK